MFKLDLKKAKESENKLPTSVRSSKKQEISRETSTSASLTKLKALTVWITAKCGNFFKKMGIPDHLTCFLKNLYAALEATVRTGHGKMDWLHIRKGVLQGYIW